MYLCNFADRIINDFCLLSLLNGNDYLPKLRGWKFLPVWEYYKELRRKEKYNDVYVFNDDNSVNATYLVELTKVCLLPAGLKAYVFQAGIKK